MGDTNCAGEICLKNCDSRLCVCNGELLVGVARENGWLCCG